jgi:allene oxide cyclase
MSKRLGILSAVIAAPAVVAGVASPAADAAAGSSGNADPHRTVPVTAIVTELNLVPVGSKGPSLGDEIVFSENLLYGGNQVGHAGAVCTTVSLVRHEAQCVATYSFRGGQITAQALIILGSSAPYAAAITGGTGKYQGAEGEVDVHPVSATTGTLTFHLEDRPFLPASS